MPDIPDPDSLEHSSCSDTFDRATVPAARVGDSTFCASLDHTIWSHGSVEPDRWHLYDFSWHHFVGGRGLSIGQIFSGAGSHVATVAQEVLVRDTRRQDG